MSTRLLSALCALFFCAQSVCAHADTHPDATELTLAGLDLEADSSEVVRILGRPQSVRWYEHPNDIGARYQRLYYRSVVVFMGPDGLKLGVKLIASDVSTRRGLAVGDPVDRAIELYGVPDERVGTELRWRIAAKYHPQLVVEARGGRVASIFVGYVVEGLRLLPNPQVEGSAQQQCCWVPVALRAPAPPHLQRYASQASGSQVRCHRARADTFRSLNRELA